MLFLVLIFISRFYIVENSTPIIIPEGLDFTRINETTNKWLHDYCGRVDERHGRKFPWTVSVMLFGENRLGGSIISPYHILTAAHGFVKFANYMYIYESYSKTACVAWGMRSKKDLDMRIIGYGGDCLEHIPNSSICNQSYMSYNKIKAVLLDYDFNMGHCVNGHDWAIIEVEKPIKFDVNVKPICLPSFKQQVEGTLTVAGWGRMYGKVDPRIHEIQMAYTSRCLLPFPNTRPRNVPDYLCANQVNLNGRMVCHGYSGSGLVQKDPQNKRSEIVGITSFGSKGCPVDESTVFTRVANYLREICYFTGVCYSLDEK